MPHLLPRRHNIRGKIGENAATSYLEKKGYTILERNFKKPQGDIDIIAISVDTLVFVEVKTRTPSLFGGGEDAMTPRKKQMLIHSAQYYTYIHPHPSRSMRIDLISIEIDETEQVRKISHYQNITGF